MTRKIWVSHLGGLFVDRQRNNGADITFQSRFGRIHNVTASNRTGVRRKLPRLHVRRRQQPWILDIQIVYWHAQREFLVVIVKNATVAEYSKGAGKLARGISLQEDLRTYAARITESHAVRRIR